MHLTVRRKLFLLTVVVVFVVVLLAPGKLAAVATVLALLALASSLGGAATFGKLASPSPTDSLVDSLAAGCVNVTGSFCPAKKEGFQGSAGAQGDQEGHDERDDQDERDTHENFLDSPLPGPRPPAVIEAADAGSANFDAYPGAIDDFEAGDGAAGPMFSGSGADAQMYVTTDDPGADDAGARGHVDRLAGDNARRRPEGNPFDLGRTATPMAAGPEVDDEANADEVDFDEANTYQARSRNDETRVIAGTMRRRAEMDKYFREEVEEREDLPWWGRHEL